jgi:hypothetical protein
MSVNVKNNNISNQHSNVLANKPNSKKIIQGGVLRKSFVTHKLNNNNNNNNEKKSNLKKTKNNIPLKNINENDKNEINIIKNTNITENNQKENSNFSLDNSFESTTTKTSEINNNTQNNNQIINSSLNIENLLTNISLSKKNKFDQDDYREMFSKYVRDDYSNSILNSLLNDEVQNENFLISHKITERMRTRMVDWMIEVLSNYHCDESTFFESVNLMDRYFKSCCEKEQILQPVELHLIGVTSMFIASKYQDIYPLRLRIMQDKIAHRKLSCDDIKNKEDEITKNLNYIVGVPTMWDFINIYIEEIFYVKFNKHHIDSNVLCDFYDIKECENEEEKKIGKFINKLYTKNMINLLNYVCVYLAKMNCHDYNLMQKKPSLLAASTIFVAIKICEQINKEEYINEYFTNKLNEVSQKNESDIIKIAQKILYNAQNFDTIFNGLDNLKKVHFNAIIELKNTK